MWLAIGVLAACGGSPAPLAPAPPASVGVAPAPEPAGVAPGATGTLDVAPPAATVAEAAPAPPALVERFDASLPTEVAVGGDLVAQVAHGAIGNRRAIVYLHGVCGNVHKFRDWTEAAVHFGTVVALLGDDKCKEPGRYKWGVGVGRTDKRILAALRAVSAVRAAGGASGAGGAGGAGGASGGIPSVSGAPLDLEGITVVGYSQGSARAEALVRAFPERYRRAILIAGPKEHAAASFHEALGIAVVGGQLDLTSHLKDAAAKAAKAGVRARYFELPAARHGDYGPAAVRVMGEALAWVFADEGPFKGTN